MSNDPHLPPSSVLHGMKTYPWKMKEAVRFEVMHEVINDEVGAINGVLSRLESREGEEFHILRKQAIQALDRLARDRFEIRATDHDRIAGILDGARERIAYWNGLIPQS